MPSRKHQLLLLIAIVVVMFFPTLRLSYFQVRQRQDGCGFVNLFAAAGAHTHVKTLFFQISLFTAQFFSCVLFTKPYFYKNDQISF